MNRPDRAEELFRMGYNCRELLNLKNGEDLPESAIRDENYYKSRSCVNACRVAAEIVSKYL